MKNADYLMTCFENLTPDTDLYISLESYALFVFFMSPRPSRIFWVNFCKKCGVYDECGEKNFHPNSTAPTGRREGRSLDLNLWFLTDSAWVSSDAQELYKINKNGYIFSAADNVSCHRRFAFLAAADLSILLLCFVLLKEYLIKLRSETSIQTKISAENQTKT